MKELLSVLKPAEILKLKLRALYEKYGYCKYEMSRFEEYGLYLKNRNFLINDAVITFTDLDGRLLALKPDVTLSIVKHSGEKEQRVYYTENVYRPDRANRSFKEIEQVGLERIGVLDAYSIGEVVALAGKSLKLISDESLLEMGHCGFITGLLKTVTNDIRIRAELARLIAEKNVNGIENLVAASNISAIYLNVLKNVPFLSGSFSEVIERAKELCLCNEMHAALEELEQLGKVLVVHDGLCDTRLDLSLFGKEDYYNGVVFSGYIKGLPFRVLSGGRYDALLGRLGKSGGALGFAIYLDELEYMYDSSDNGKFTVVRYADHDDITHFTSFINKLTAEGKKVYPCVSGTKIEFIPQESIDYKGE